MTKIPKQMTSVCASQLFRDCGGVPHAIFNEERRKYDKFVRFEKSGQIIGPFLTLKDYKRAAIDTYVETFRIVPTFPRPLN